MTDIISQLNERADVKLVTQVNEQIVIEFRLIDTLSEIGDLYMYHANCILTLSH